MVLQIQYIIIQTKEYIVKQVLNKLLYTDAHDRGDIYIIYISTILLYIYISLYIQCGRLVSVKLTLNFEISRRSN